MIAVSEYAIAKIGYKDPMIKQKDAVVQSPVNIANTWQNFEPDIRILSWTVSVLREVVGEKIRRTTAEKCAPNRNWTYIALRHKAYVDSVYWCNKNYLKKWVAREYGQSSSVPGT